LGFNTISDGDGLRYPGGSAPLPQAIRDATTAYRGNISVANILATLRAERLATLAEAAAIHQTLLDSLDTRVGIERASLDPDAGAKIAVGNSWYSANDAWRFGVLLNGHYGEKHRNEDQRRERI